MADKNIFREKSIERISSPDQLNEYIKVSSPGVWVAMLAVVIFLAGVIYWAVNGRVDVFLPAVVSAESGQTTLYIPCDKADDNGHVFDGAIDFQTDLGRYVLHGDTDMPKPTEITDDLLNSLDDKIAYEGQFKKGDWIYIFKGESDLPDGAYECNVVAEEYAPINFITN